MAGAQAARPGACEGAPVSVVQVETNRPQFSGMRAWWRKIARALGLHHETTAPGIVRRFVTLDPGKRCTEFRREESERILRAQPYLSDASVTTDRVGDSIHVNVATVDEVPVVGGARLRGASIQALSLGTMNFGGAGMHVEGRWEQGRSRRDGVGAKISHPQLFGRPYALAFDGLRRPLGEYYSTSLSHAFLTDLQRVAWNAGYGVAKDYAQLRRPDHSMLVQPVDRATWNVGGVARFGPPRRLGFIGGMVLGERVAPRFQFAVLDSAWRLVPADTTGMRNFPAYDATNIAGVLGLRALTFTQMRGLDAIAATQDVATGTQVATMLGFRPFLENAMRTAFGAVDAYAGGRTRRHYAAARAELESRLDLDRGNWQHLVASGRAAWYYQPRRRWTSELSVEGAGVWRPVLPFQLELGDRQGGVRGYARSYEPGGQRLLARLEQRVDLARYQDTRAAFGAAAFSDVGKVWSGDAPFGVTTPVRASAGVALLAAVPARSRRTMRVELAVPFSQASGARSEVRFLVREPIAGFWSDPPRIAWARLSNVERIFSWP